MEQSVLRHAANKPGAIRRAISMSGSQQPGDDNTLCAGATLSSAPARVWQLSVNASER